MSDSLEMKVRTTEATTREVFVDINDLIIDLMLEVEKATSQDAKSAIKQLINKLTKLRNEGHARAE